VEWCEGSRRVGTFERRGPIPSYWGIVVWGVRVEEGGEGHSTLALYPSTTQKGGTCCLSEEGEEGWKDHHGEDNSLSSRACD
jgi:hypothetical protein